MSKKIVFLDAATVDYGDLDLSPLKELGEVITYDVTAPDQVVERIRDATVVITNKIVFDADTIDQCSTLKLIAVAATGFNIIDIEAASNKGIAVANVPAYSTTSVAQLTMAYIFALATNLISYDRAVHNGDWSRSQIFTMGDFPVFDLHGKSIGILGYGDIGKRVAELCRACGMRVFALKREGVSYDVSVERLNLHEIAEEADFISIHMPLTEYSQHLANKELFRSMKKSAFLINVARGPIVHAEDLVWALEEGEIAGAALDVMDNEPPSIDDPLLRAPNCIITPHVAWASIGSRTRLIQEIALNIKAHMLGEKRNIVNAM